MSFLATELSRRALLASAAACLGEGCAPARAPEPGRDALAEVEARVGGRVGVFALDTATGKQVSRRADERFALCSTFKWALAAAVLVRVDRGELDLAERVAFAERDLLEYAPAARQNVEAGFMTLEALAEASVTVSDNTAANLLLAKTGGPAGLTRFFRQHGDAVTRLDRDEPSLNSNLPGDPRDTTSPRAMAGLLQAVLTGSVLSAESRGRLLGWMRASPTGRDRLRAGLPPSFVAGDKTGTGANGAVNDVAIVWPPRRAPLVIAAYLSEGRGSLEAAKAAHVEIGRLVAAELRG